MQVKVGDILSYNQMCMIEGYSLQRGMNFRVNGGQSVILMSLRKGAPYEDRVEDDGSTIIYEGHDVAKNVNKSPKTVDQPLTLPSGKLTANGKFYHAAEKYKSGDSDGEFITVYEKIKDGIWVYNGVFELTDAWQEKSDGRKVFKFKLKITDDTPKRKTKKHKELLHNRVIPTRVKLAVWKRDKAMCVKCGSKDNLHFDHILPYSKGGTSLKEENIQLLCARHNLRKSDKIE